MQTQKQQAEQTEQTEQAESRQTQPTQRAQPGIEEDELTHFLAECLALALVEDVRADRADLYSESGEASASPLSDTSSPTSSPTTEGGTITEKEVEPADEVPDETVFAPLFG